MKKIRYVTNVIYTILFIFASNSYNLINHEPMMWIASVLAIIVSNVFIGSFDLKIKNKRLAICNHGCSCLAIFSFSVIITGIYHLVLIFSHKPFGWSLLMSVIAHTILFWNGIISVYCTSVQLGVAKRIVGLICGPIPVAHLFALYDIIKTTSKEIKTECQKQINNQARKGQEVCKTKYPLLFVHGVFFRDRKLLNYWGRIPGELVQNGAVVYYGEHQSALSVKDSANEIGERIKKIVKETNCGKVNIIAHSKGGLDVREAIHSCDIAKYIATVTTINTPHRGCGFADYLLEKIPEDVQRKVASAYNGSAVLLGDKTPDFMSAIKDITSSSCVQRDEELGVPEGIYCQSVGSIQKKAGNGKFPVNFTYDFVKHFDGENDGLVSEKSFKWGDNYTLIKPPGKRGITHADMIDLNRENIDGFDVREFYVELVCDLKNKGF